MFGLQDGLLERVARRARACLTMTADIWLLLVGRRCWSLLAGLFSAADAAIGGFSRARAEELQAEGRAGAAPARRAPRRPGALPQHRAAAAAAVRDRAIVLVARVGPRRSTTALLARACSPRSA